MFLLTHSGAASGLAVVTGLLFTVASQLLPVVCFPGWFVYLKMRTPGSWNCPHV